MRAVKSIEATDWDYMMIGEKAATMILENDKA